ncbi:hypothetical protein ACWCO0_30120 [Streptomyces tubercidicus]
MTTSPAVTLRGSAAPSRRVCATMARTVRKVASIRILVMVRCRMTASQAFATPTPSSTAAQPSSTGIRPGTSPSSMARDST